MPRVTRGFVEIAGGQVHYRCAGREHALGRPALVMIHASPGSSKMLEDLAKRFGETRCVYALDTLGNGDSSPPPSGENPDLPVFVAGHQQAIDALGIQTFDLYGSHTGGNIACEIAIAWPGRVRRLILDGMSLFSEEEREEMLRNYAPPIEIKPDGSHLNWIWNYVRDTYRFWPWYQQDAAHVRDLGLPSADVLHDKVVEVIKAARTYRLSYNAAFAYRKEQRLPLVRTPTLLTCARTDMLYVYLDRVAALMPAAQRDSSANAGEAMVRMLAFLDSEMA